MKADDIIKFYPEVLEDGPSYPRVRSVYKEHYKNKREANWLSIKR
jgi:hypothetical protein